MENESGAGLDAEADAALVERVRAKCDKGSASVGWLGAGSVVLDV